MLLDVLLLLLLLLVIVRQCSERRHLARLVSSPVGAAVDIGVLAFGPNLRVMFVFPTK